MSNSLRGGFKSFDLRAVVYIYMFSLQRIYEMCDTKRRSTSKTTVCRRGTFTLACVCHAMKDISSILWSKAQDGIILLSLAHDGFKPRHADIPCYLLTPVLLFLCV